MIELTDKQIEMLYEMSDLHYKWFQKYTPEYDMSYEEVIKLNHQKMFSILESCKDYSEEMVDFIFESIIKDYKMMNDDYEK